MKERMNIHKSMKHIVLLLTGTFMFASCADDEIISNDNLLTGKGISFNIANDKEAWKPDTRSAQAKSEATLHCEAPDGGFSIDATVVDGIRSFQTEQPQSRGTQTTAPGSNWSYKVGAYYYQTADAAPIDFFTENATGGLTFGSEGTGTSTYYWPKNGNISFFAVAPANIQGFNVPTAENIAAPSFTYTIDSDVTKHQDIMVARTAAINTPTAAVGLQFEHLLAAVHFKMGDMIATQVNSITISGIKGGEVTFGYSDGKWTPTNYGETNASYALTLGTQDQEGNWEAGKLANTLNLDKGADISGNINNSMLLLAPQELSEAQVTVNYTELLVLTEGKPTTNEKTINLPIHTWEAGKTYAYTLNVNSSLNIELPNPGVQDAHFIMVNLGYDLTPLQSLPISNLEVSVIDYKYDDQNGTLAHSTNEDSFILKYEDRKEAHKRGYWATEEIKIENKYDSNGKLMEGYPKETTYSLLTVNNKKLTLLNNAKVEKEDANSIMLYLGENNGECNREVVLRVTGEYDGKNITVGSGKFTQLCPSWNENDYGCERIEDSEAPFGFYWNRTVTYTTGNKYVGLIANSTYESLFDINTDNLDVGDYSSNGGFIQYTIKEGSILLWSYKYISSVSLHFELLSQLGQLTTADNGLANTINLHKKVGSVNITDIEEDLDKISEDYTLNIFGFKIPLINVSKPGDNADPITEYAAAIALKCNEVVSVFTENDANGTIIPLYTFNLADEDVNWYLPSSNEAIDLSDQEYALDGEYWTSTAGLDPDLTKEGQEYGYASSVKYTDNKLDNTYGTNGVLATDARNNVHKIRAVRKKP